MVGEGRECAFVVFAKLPMSFDSRIASISHPFVGSNVPAFTVSKILESTFCIMHQIFPVACPCIRQECVTQHS